MNNGSKKVFAVVMQRISMSFAPITSWAGTPHYIAPEHWRGTCGEKSDVYALGIILNECATRRLPWLGYHDHYQACWLHPALVTSAACVPSDDCVLKL